jgi:serine protease Do
LWAATAVFSAADTAPNKLSSDQVKAATESAVAAVKPALVRIHVVSTDYEDGREIKMESSGSGVIITKEGHVVTNHHVAGDATRITCTMADKTEVEAELVGTDPLADIAVIKLQDKRDYPIAEFGDSSKLQVGDRIFAMGSPLSLSQSVTTGIVSNTEMIMPSMFWPMTMELDGEDVGSMVRWIGHDAQIFGGNSGGPLVNTEGKIVGINEISLGLAGAIPGNLAKSVAEQLTKNGKVVRAWIGLEVQPLLKASQIRNGVLVSGTVAGSPSDKAGFKPGDLLTKLAGKEVSVKFPEEMPLFNQYIASLPVGQEIEAVVLRGGAETTLRLTTTEREKAEDKVKEFKSMGVCVTNISTAIAREPKRKDTNGILVVSIRPGGQCEDAKPAISEGDIIIEVGGKPVKNMADLAVVTAEITKGKTEPTPTLVSFDRDTERYLTVVNVGERDEEDPGLEVRKAWLPVSSQVLTTELAQALNMAGKTGVRVTQVYAGTSAEKAGLKVGDIILKLDGDDIPASQPEDVEVLPTMIRQYEIGSTVELSVLRDNKPMKLKVELAESPMLAREMKKFHDPNFEFTVRDVSFMDRAQQNISKETKGAYVESVEEGGWAALARLAVGDIILAVDSKPVEDMSGLEAVMKSIAESKPNSVVFKVKRGIYDIFIEILPKWNDI